ncbi:hypothetical protein SAMN05216332_103169 [Nitrosospira briensis]|nr:hypothetical protein SAMN05216332_103169 [Nitrosospira briensis]
MMNRECRTAISSIIETATQTLNSLDQDGNYAAGMILSSRRKCVPHLSIRTTPLSSVPASVQLSLGGIYQSAAQASAAVASF